MRKLRNRAVAFLRDEDGLILVEALIMLPLLIWALVAMFIYWDVFRTINVTQKAAYSVADLLSRQRTDIKLDFANGLQKVVNFLTPGGHPVRVRITSIECDSPNGTKKCDAGVGTLKLLFSFSPENKVPALTQAQIQPWKAVKVPTMEHGESLFIVETEVQFKTQIQTVLAGFLINVQDNTFGEFIVTRPRNRRLCLEGTNTCT